jgi:gas vesicle protein
VETKTAAATLCVSVAGQGSADFSHRVYSSTKWEKTMKTSESSKQGIDRREDGMKSLIMGFFMGFIAGATVAMILTPRSGSETRQMVMRSGKQAYESGGKVMEPAKKVVEPAKKVVEPAKKLTDSVKGKAEEATAVA